MSAVVVAYRYAVTNYIWIDNMCLRGHSVGL